MRGKYEHASLKNQKLSNKISEKILFGIDLKKLLNANHCKGFGPLKNIKIKTHC